MTHRCPVSTCTVTDVPDSKLMCYPDWARVPGPLQQAVYRAYDKGRGVGTVALARAQETAIAAVERRLAEAPPPQPPAPKPSPHQLWEQAGGGTGSFDQARFLELMHEAGHLLRPGDPGYEHGVSAASCGWRPGGNEAP